MNIVFYTHKASMIRNWVLPLSQFLDANIYVFHINSLDKEKLFECAPVQLIDIAEYSATDIIKKFEQIKPAAFISLGFRSLIELLLRRVCKRLSIKAIYLEHGLFTVDTAALNMSNAKGRPAYVTRKYLNFMSKYLQFVFCGKNWIREVQILYWSFFRKKYSVSRYDKALFFAEHGFAETNKLFSYPIQDVMFCGYPLFHSNAEAARVVNGGHETGNQSRAVVYVHQPFILNRQTSITYKEEVGFVEEIWGVLKGDFDSFQLLLHPRESLSRYQKLFEKTEIEIIQKPNDYNVFLNKDLIIGHYSTALLYPLYFKIQTIVMEYPCVEIDRVYAKFCTYCQKPCDLSKYLLEKEGQHNGSVEFGDVNYLIGRDNSYENVANKIQELL